MGSREESEIVGFFVFSHIRMVSYYRLGLLRVNDCPAWLENRPRRVRAWARNRRKATLKIRRNPSLLIFS